MLGYLSLDIISSLELTDFLELCSRKTVRFSEQIMSADKIISEHIFTPNGDYSLCIEAHMLAFDVVNYGKQCNIGFVMIFTLWLDLWACFKIMLFGIIHLLVDHLNHLFRTLLAIIIIIISFI